ncbi:hypothetical protein ACFOVU_11005 [Nocardiopsis sediminis]|uniref:DUF4352 domain-containing protein n=1 Tax=Nocardiopsis sediminis TaxID=1778267 RepID=A0ABV8FMZ7_9ACTN
MYLRSPLKAAAPALALVLLLAGCSGGGDGGNGGGDEDGASPGTSAETTDVVAETTWPYQRRGGEAEAEIHALQVRGRLMQLTITVTAGDFGDEATQSLYDLWGTFGAVPYLVDNANLTRHNVVYDSGTTLQGPNVVDTRLTPGEPRDLSYTFAAPPEDVETMDLYIGELPPITDVPVQR